MKKRILASICALACACTMSSPVYAKDLTSEADLSTHQLDRSAIQTMSEKGNYNITVRSNSQQATQADFTTITGTLNASNLTDTCTITVPERAALILYSSATYPSTSVSIELKSQTGTSLETQYLGSSITGISEEVDDGILVEPGTYTLTYTVSSSITDNVTYTTDIVGYTASPEENVDLGTGYIGFHKAGEDVYKKVTVTKGGLLEIGAAECSGWGKYTMTGDANSFYMYGQKVTLYNSKKEPITEEASTTSTSYYTNYYAVKAGTYYVKLSSSYDGYYTFATALKTGGITNNTSKAKAQKLSSKYKATLMPIGGSSKTRWYKVTLKKSKKIKIFYDFYGTGDCAAKITVCNSKGKKLTYASTIYSERSGKLSTQRKYPKGTYYVQVSKPDSSSYSMEGMLYLKVK